MTADTRSEIGHFEFDWPRFTEWRTKCVSLVGPIAEAVPAHRALIERFSSLAASVSAFELGLSTLRGLRDDLAAGMLDRVADQIEAEVAADLMTQAETLLGEGAAGRHNHIPAGVLAGAVLERGLRSMCEARRPPIPIRDRNGPLKVVVLIEALKSAGAYNELVAKQLRAWTGIRNACAHGEWDAVTRDQVQQLVEGARDFVARHLGS